MSTSTSDAASFLMGTASPSAKFSEIGATITGPITRIGDPMQQTDIATGEPKTWNDGSPRLQLPVDVKTDQRDPDIDGDDGTRTLYIKGNMQAAVREAVKKAGAKMLEIGGTLTVTYEKDGTAKNKGFNPPKIYTATYTPPTNTAAAEFLGANDETPAAAAAAGGDAEQTPEVKALLEQLAAQGVKATVG